jgi:nucleoid-associated protein YgaU
VAHPQGSDNVGREQKLALVIGFSVMLLVGVLLTDHLSRARTVQVAGVDEREPGQVILPVWDETRLNRQLPELTATDRPGDQPPVHTPPGQPPAAEPEAAGRRFAGADPDILVPLGPEAAPQPPAGESPPRRHVIIEISRGMGVDLTPVDGRPNTPAVVEPGWEPEHYTVQRGDSLFQICAAKYGTGHVWRKLLEYNPGRIGPEGQVREGVRLVLPPRAVILGPEAAEPARPAAPSPRPAPARTYVVKKGDSLSEIAQRELGTVRRQEEILTLNRDQLSDPDSIRVGMKLLLPAG